MAVPRGIEPRLADWKSAVLTVRRWDHTKHESLSIVLEQSSHSNLNHKVAERTGLEPATSCVTGRRSSQLNYRSTNNITVVWCVVFIIYQRTTVFFKKDSQLRDSNSRPAAYKADALPAELSWLKATLGSIHHLRKSWFLSLTVLLMYNINLHCFIDNTIYFT